VISVIDYGVANVGSMLNMLRRAGAEATVAADCAAIERADRLILPGIGAFDHGVDALSARGFIPSIRRRVLEGGVPLLGVCLGMQLLGRASAEGAAQGLGLIDASCVRFDSSQGLRVPHMGWAHLSVRREHPLLGRLDATARFYFVHSYHVVCADPGDVLAVATYGEEFTAMIHRRNILGAQFHPEKSHRFGMQLLKSFSEL